MIRLNRHQVFLVLFAGLLLARMVPNLLFLIGSDTTVGTIVQTEAGAIQFSDHRDRSLIPSHTTTVRTSLPLAAYQVGEQYYELYGPVTYSGNEVYQIGDPVTIAYKKSNPGKACFYTLSGFWFSHYLYWIIALFIVLCFVYTWLDATQYLILRARPQNGERRFEVTTSEKRKLLRAGIARIYRRTRPR